MPSSEFKIEYKHLLLFFVACVCISKLEDIVYEVKYLKYIIAPIAICLWIAGGGIKKQGLFLSPLVLSFLIFLAWGGMTLFWGNSNMALKDIIFIASYTLPITFFFTAKLNMKSVFIIYLTFFVLSLNAREIGSFSITDSTTLYEGADSFVYGAFLLFFFMKRQYFFSALALILLLITLKRIALLGVIICMAVWFFPKKLQSYILSTSSIIALNSLAVVLIILVGSGILDDAFQSLTGKGASELTLGRISYYQGVIEDIAENPSMLFFGNGTGSAYDKASYYYSGDIEYANLHSDTLKILYEYGVFVFITFFYLLSKCQTVEGRIFIVYLSVLFITDNVLIYVTVMLTILLIILSAEQKSQTLLFEKVKSKIINTGSSYG